MQITRRGLFGMIGAALVAPKVMPDLREEIAFIEAEARKTVATTSCVWPPRHSFEGIKDRLFIEGHHADPPGND